MTNETTAPVHSLHDKIMRLPCMPPKNANANQMLDYKSGHRDARYAAAELAAAHEADAQQAAPVAVPDGWKLVPVEPTKAMWTAVNKLDDEMAAGGYDGKGCSIEQAWSCMLSAAPTPPAQQPRNRYGVDARYFHSKLGLLLRDFDSLMPDELARSLARLAKVADEAVLSEPEFAAPPAQQSQWQWVPVSKQLPPLDIPIWLSDRVRGVFIGMRSSSSDGWLWAECDVYRFFGGQWESISAHFDDFEPSHWMPLPTIPGDTAAQEQAWPRLAISSQEQLAALLASVPALHEISAELIAECVFEQMQAAHSDIAALPTPEQAEQPNDDPTPPEALASRLISIWVETHGKPIPWAHAVRITAIATNLPQQEIDRLLAMDDAAPEQAEQSYPVNRSVIRDVFLRNGFTIKEGHSDLKPYVYAAAEELLALDGKAVAVEQDAVTVPRELLADLISPDHDTRIQAERKLYVVLGGDA